MSLKLEGRKLSLIQEKPFMWGFFKLQNYGKNGHILWCEQEILAKFNVYTFYTTFSPNSSNISKTQQKFQNLKGIFEKLNEIEQVSFCDNPTNVLVVVKKKN